MRQRRGHRAADAVVVQAREPAERDDRALVQQVRDVALAATVVPQRKSELLPPRGVLVGLVAVVRGDVVDLRIAAVDNSLEEEETFFCRVSMASS